MIFNRFLIISLSIVAISGSLSSAMQSGGEEFGSVLRRELTITPALKKRKLHHNNLRINPLIELIIKHRSDTNDPVVQRGITLFAKEIPLYMMLDSIALLEILKNSTDKENKDHESGNYRDDTFNSLRQLLSYRKYAMLLQLIDEGDIAAINKLLYPPERYEHEARAGKV